MVTSGQREREIQAPKKHFGRTARVEGRTHKTIVLAAIAYFLSAVTIVIACFVTFFWLRRLPFVLHYVELSNKICIEVFSGTLEENDGQSAVRTVDSSLRSEPQESNSVSDRTNGDPVSYDSRTLSPCRMGGPETESLLVAHERSAMKTGMDNGLDVVRNCFALCCFRPTEGKRRCRAYWSRYVSCLAECWPHCLSVWCVFFCSLSVFPAILSMVRPVDPNYFISPVWFTDVTCFLFFNLFAMIGCIVCNWVQFPGPRYLWIPVWFRALVFIPFFLFCNFGFAEPKLPVLVANDHVYVLGIILFSFTNGYFASLAMMYAPRSCPPERSELTGMLAAFCLILGVCSGVYTSRGLVSIVL
ncbi:hypothetical protein P879_03428 [Paragonimus westermani]|uniref:Solute carrier family 29 (Equilibrative nucleoside transporter), member 1/2/3 n=1 Tax=Paragonimus westermani TaxID=34504 RepID=A0A8T0DKI5_9TREM|nr:hypothetical protein P879_03428 [Paragonimus westermani]